MDSSIHGYLLPRISQITPAAADTESTFSPLNTREHEHQTAEIRSIQWVKDVLRVDCDIRIKLEFHGDDVASDAGLIAYRELDETM